MTRTAQIKGVRVADTPSGVVAIVILEVLDSDDILPVFTRIEMGAQITRGLDPSSSQHLHTHDLLLNVVEELGGRLSGILLSEAPEEIFTAELELVTPRNEITIPARPGDAIALAARTSISIRIDTTTFESRREPSSNFTELDELRDVLA